ncbi:MAG TPA: substrate-binding domain-containing protein [Solirubrobacteraceae bacterium]|nr:substrate-binding domain-containing protein [Solirubrobacteraceae bacterium]
MTSSKARRVLACVASVAMAAAVMPATASAKKSKGGGGPETDRGAQCSGSSINGRGSTFQNPAQLIWNPGFNKTSAKKGGCPGSPTVDYKNTESKDRGSGSCLKAFGAEKHAVEREIDFCGTDEAPNAKQKEEIELHAEAGVEPEALETVPVLQGAVAVIVHLPAGCTASAEADIGGTTKAIRRLVLDQATVEGLYRGTISTWEGLLTAQGTDGHDAIVCKEPSELKEQIKRVVRQDHSGTTHIFKTFLEQVYSGKFEAEEYLESYEGSSTGCGAVFPPEEKTWEEVAEACPNQRWPEAAHVKHAKESGNPGVINEVASNASSVGYADLAVAREYGQFSKKGQGGEGYSKFWVPVQNGEGLTYAEPSTDGDSEKGANSNCKGSEYVEGEGKHFPPASTRALWNQAKAYKYETGYPICGLTYDLAYRQYGFFGYGTEEVSKNIATTVENYLNYEVNAKGGGKAIAKKHDYEALPSSIITEAKKGIEEIGWKKA